MMLNKRQVIIFVAVLSVLSAILLTFFKKDIVLFEERKIVAQSFKDPGSVIFDNDFRVGENYCGYANAKNGYGAYGGSSRFVLVDKCITLSESGDIYRNQKSKNPFCGSSFDSFRFTWSLDVEVAALRAKSKQLEKNEGQVPSMLELKEQVVGEVFEQKWVEYCSK